MLLMDACSLWMPGLMTRAGVLACLELPARTVVRGRGGSTAGMVLSVGRLRINPSPQLGMSAVNWEEALGGGGGREAMGG